MRIAVINSPFRSHIGRMDFIFQELKKMGHTIELWGSGSTETIAEEYGFIYRNIPLKNNYIELMQLNLAQEEYYTMVFFPMALEQLPYVLDYCEKYSPDILEANTRVFAGVIANMINKIPVVTHCCSGNSFSQIPEDLYGYCIKGTEPEKLKRIMLNFSKKYFETTDEWFNKNISQKYNIQNVKNAIGLCSPDKAIAHSIKELSKERISKLNNVHLTGPIINEEKSNIDFIKYKKYCYLTLGTCPWEIENIKNRYRIIIDGIPKEYNVIIGLGNSIKKEELGKQDKRIIIYNNAPQIDAIKHADFVICHGGCQTVHESLYYGKPIIGIPHYAELNEMINSVELKGAAIKINPGKLTSKIITDSVFNIMSDDYIFNTKKLSEKIKLTDAKNNIINLFLS